MPYIRRHPNSTAVDISSAIRRAYPRASDRFWFDPWEGENIEMQDFDYVDVSLKGDTGTSATMTYQVYRKILPYL